MKKFWLEKSLSLVDVLAIIIVSGLVSAWLD